MKRFLAEAVTVCLVACGVPRAVGAVRVAADSDRAHPAYLMGGWVDLAKTEARDTSVWLLLPGGDDHTLRIRAEPGGTAARRDEKHYGRWFVRSGNLLCVVRRSGRSAASCSSFAVDTVTLDGVMRRRLTVQGYRGRHSTGDRVLLERPMS